MRIRFFLLLLLFLNGLALHGLSLDEAIARHVNYVKSRGWPVTYDARTEAFIDLLKEDPLKAIETEPELGAPFLVFKIYLDESEVYHPKFNDENVLPPFMKWPLIDSDVAIFKDRAIKLRVDWLDAFLDLEDKSGAGWDIYEVVLRDLTYYYDEYVTPIYGCHVFDKVRTFYSSYDFNERNQGNLEEMTRGFIVHVFNFNRGCWAYLDDLVESIALDIGIDFNQVFDEEFSHLSSLDKLNYIMEIPTVESSAKVDFIRDFFSRDPFVLYLFNINGFALNVLDLENKESVVDEFKVAIVLVNRYFR